MSARIVLINGSKFELEFGNVRDNESALILAVYELQHGRYSNAHIILHELQCHIEETQENKSVRWILPQVKKILGTIHRSIALGSAEIKITRKESAKLEEKRD